jgi:hypothetical protein
MHAADRQQRGPCHQAKVVAQQSGDVQLSLNERKTDTKSIEDNPETHWIYQRLRETLVRLNRQTFRFQLKRFSAPEILRYEASGFYAPPLGFGPRGNGFTQIECGHTLVSPRELYRRGIGFLSAFYPLPTGAGHPLSLSLLYDA